MRQRVTQRLRRALIEKNTHLCGSKRASRGVIEHGTHLFKRHAGEPFDELRRKGAVLEVLEKRRHGYSGAAE